MVVALLFAPPDDVVVELGHIRVDEEDRALFDERAVLDIAHCEHAAPGDWRRPDLERHPPQRRVDDRDGFRKIRIGFGQAKGLPLFPRDARLIGHEASAVSPVGLVAMARAAEQAWPHSGRRSPAHPVISLQKQSRSTAGCLVTRAGAEQGGDRPRSAHVKRATSAL